MIAEISGGLGSLKAAYDIAKGLNATVTGTRIAEIKLELLGHLGETQQALFASQQNEAALTQRVGQLEAEITRLRDWSAEVERYELKAVGTGAFAYMQKEGVRTEEPAHWLCATCFGNTKKSILQREDQGRERLATRKWTCPVCRNSIGAGWNTIPSYEGVE